MATSMEHPSRSLDPARTTLLLIDFQEKLMPSISEGREAVANAVRLAEAAHLLRIPVIGTEQNPRGLGSNVPEIKMRCAATVPKVYFDATREHGFGRVLPADRPSVVVAGCETHVCVMQTVLGLLAGGRRVHLVRDAVGSRTLANREAAITRLSAAGADIVTSEMVIFDWLATSDHPAFRRVLPLVK